MFESRTIFDDNLNTILKTEAPDDIIAAAMVIMELLEGDPVIHLMAEDSKRIWISDEPVEKLYFYVRGFEAGSIPLVDLTIERRNNKIVYKVQGSLDLGDILQNNHTSDPEVLVAELRKIVRSDPATYFRHQRNP